MVFIIVAVQKHLKDVIEGLRLKGHQVVDPESYNYPIDAVVYQGSSFQMSYISTNNMPQQSMGHRSGYGVFMLNCQGKSIDMIDKMLRMRCYERLI